MQPKQQKRKRIIINRQTLTEEQARQALVQAYREGDLDDERLPEIVHRLETLGFGKIIAEVCHV